MHTGLNPLLTAAKVKICALTYMYKLTECQQLATVECKIGQHTKIAAYYTMQWTKTVGGFTEGLMTIIIHCISNFAL